MIGDGVLKWLSFQQHRLDNFSALGSLKSAPGEGQTLLWEIDPGNRSQR